MSDVTVSVVENNTLVTVSGDVVDIDVTESIVEISSATSGPQGAAGVSGVISVVSPITNTGTSGSAVIGITQALLSLTKSQISDFTSGTVTFANTSGTATFATTSGTASYATTSGTSVSISGSITKSQVSDFTSGTVAAATSATTATTSGTASYATTSGTAVSISGSITKSQVSDFTSGTVAQATNASTAVFATTSGTALFATNASTAVSISGSITKSQVSDFTSGTVTTISGSITKSQVSDFTSGTVASATLAGTATYATTSGTATYATTSGTAVSISGSITKSQVSDFTSGTAVPASHTHGNISNTGTLTTVVTPSASVAVLTTNSSNTIGLIGTATNVSTQFLRGDGTWQVPAGGGGAFTGGTLTSGLVLAQNGTTLAPLTYQGGTVLTTPVAGVAEYDSTVFYETPNATSGRALNPATYYYASTASWNPDFSTTSTQKSLLGGASVGITVAAGTTFEYELYTGIEHQYVTTSGISSSYNIIGTTVTGSPVLSTRHTIDFGSNTTGFTTASSLSTVRTTTSVAYSAAISTGSRFNVLKAKGILRVTGTGTMKIYPAITTSAASADNVWTVNIGTVFKLTPIGNGTVTTVGTWA